MALRTMSDAISFSVPRRPGRFKHGPSAWTAAYATCSTPSASLKKFPHEAAGQGAGTERAREGSPLPVPDATLIRYGSETVVRSPVAEMLKVPAARLRLYA